LYSNLFIFYIILQLSARKICLPSCCHSSPRNYVWSD